jgi:lysophospholipid acyltransferase (LPLAT)-like uncharacterized protein
MKIRNRFLISVIAFLLSLVVRLWIGTLRYRYLFLGPNVEPHQPGLRGRYIYAFWHENLLLLAYQYARPDIYVLISRHADGQLISDVCKHLGFSTVRGSTTRGGADAVRQMMRVGQNAHLAITPDGPRGPRRKVQQGLTYLAARTGMAIVPIGIAFRKAWRLRSWDRFALPKPWSPAVCVTGQTIEVPENADRELLAEYTDRVESEMSRLTEIAECRVESGQLETDQMCVADRKRRRAGRSYIGPEIRNRSL